MSMNAKKIQIDIAALQKQINAIFEHILQIQEVEKVNLEEDYYWHLHSNSRYDVTKEPCKMGIGSLADDLEFLSDESVIDDISNTSPLMLMHVAPLLEYLATEAGWFGERDEDGALLGRKRE